MSRSGGTALRLTVFVEEKLVREGVATLDEVEVIRYPADPEAR